MLRVDKFYSESVGIIHFVYCLYNERFKEVFSEQSIDLLHWERGYPLSAPKRLNPELDVDSKVFITSEKMSWCQIIYQLSHEFSHVAMGCCPNNKKIKWISECLCEAASIYTLKKSIPFFEERCPSYVRGAKEYIDNIIIKSPTFFLEEIKDYISDNICELKEDPTEDTRDGRPRNDVIGKHWVKFIEENEEGWAAIALFSEIEDEEMDEVTFLKEWYLKCRNENERNFVMNITETIL